MCKKLSAASTFVEELTQKNIFINQVTFNSNTITKLIAIKKTLANIE